MPGASSLSLRCRCACRADRRFSSREGEGTLPRACFTPPAPVPSWRPAPPRRFPERHKLQAAPACRFPARPRYRQTWAGQAPTFPRGQRSRPVNPLPTRGEPPTRAESGSAVAAGPRLRSPGGSVHARSAARRPGQGGRGADTPRQRVWGARR
ncbi:translation initiation factor IF-2-like [Apus apus]|uniref:translation initiation factor IF-2-like n=1 Tax=Apus apus TaxID=8895 RepID=UPI0021F86049|nr:translation initiation factor IF-2-like [Apus apus]